MSQKKFGPGDKIFAKVRGYPPWPARVEGVADETPNKMKYHVYFYGTAETAVCKSEELFPYVEFRNKYGKPLKKRGFNEAVLQVDAELGLTPDKGVADVSVEDSDQEGNLVIDETPGGTSKKSVTKIQKFTPQTTPLGKLKITKRKSDDNVNEDLEFKKRRSIKKSNLTDEPSQIKSIEVTRSGRKIKPKKFSDQSDDFDTQQEESILNEININDTPKINPTKPRKSISTSDVIANNSADKLNSESTLADVELDPEFLENGILVAHTPGGQEFRLKLDLGVNRPIFKNEKARQQWEARVIKDGKRLKYQIESGETIPESLKREIEQKYNARVLQMEQNRTSIILDDKREKLTYLKIEAQLLDIDCRIKCSLTLKQADPEICLRTLDELLELKLNPLMVKKHPQIVETIKKLRKYVGNVSVWEMNEVDACAFSTRAGHIRAKAEHVYNKIKSMFLVPYGKSFWDVFSVALTEFNNKTEHLPLDDVFALTTDPTCATPQEVSAADGSDNTKTE